MKAILKEIVVWWIDYVVSKVARFMKRAWYMSPQLQAATTLMATFLHERTRVGANVSSEGKNSPMKLHI